ncbi:MAG TPA: TRAP transporter substrate-binding protein [Burkholderiales bacterium]|nr:TRAP transporter substrate-binding protein [Burkholderiales bacterium]
MRFDRTLLAVAAFAAFAVAGAAQAQTTWDLPTAYPTTNFHTENVQLFIDDIGKATGGKLKINLHANASLIKAPDIKRAIRGGQVQIGEILLANFANEDPVYELDGVPFLAASYADSMKLYKAQKTALDKLLGSQGMKLLYTVPWGPQGIYSKREISSVADMKGLKWRAYSPATNKIAELVNATPVTIQAAELSQALATGVVDSYMSSLSTGFDTKTFESVKNWYDTQAWLPKNAVIVSQKAFDALDKPTQEAVLKAAAAAETRGWKMSQDKNQWYAEQMTKNGMKIIKPTPKLSADMKQVGSIMLADWLKRAGPDGKAVVDAYRKM